MSNIEDYNNKLATISAIKEIKSPNMPVDIYLQEAEDLHHWSLDDKAKLMGAGLDAALIGDLPVRAGACREAQSLWTKERNTREEAEQEWKDKSPGAYELRDELLHSFRYGFRKRDDLLSRVKEIAEGDGHADMIHDHNDLAVLGRENKPLLKKIKLDMAKLDLAAATANEMADVLSRANGERSADSQVRVVRDQAYTYLKEAVDEIRSCGKYVFWKNKNRLKGYRSEYIRTHN